VGEGARGRAHPTSRRRSRLRSPCDRGGWPRTTLSIRNRHAGPPERPLVLPSHWDPCSQMAVSAGSCPAVACSAGMRLSSDFRRQEAVAAAAARVCATSPSNPASIGPNRARRRPFRPLVDYTGASRGVFQDFPGPDVQRGERGDRGNGGGVKRGPGARSGRRDYSHLPRFEMFWDFPFVVTTRLRSPGWSTTESAGAPGRHPAPRPPAPPPGAPSANGRKQAH
jgi:hypothetical protein